MLKLMNVGNAMKCLAAAGAVVMAMVAAGCASPSSNAPSSAATGTALTASHSAAPHAQCLVCKYDADLACVDVTVDQETPTYVFEGKTYYFCSKSCCKKFEKDPA